MMGLIDPGRAITALFVGIGMVVGFALLRWLKSFMDAKRKVNMYEMDLAVRRLKDAQDNMQLSDLILRANDDMRKRTDSGDGTDSH